jgi:hypothetical protein
MLPEQLSVVPAGQLILHDRVPSQHRIGGLPVSSHPQHLFRPHGLADEGLELLADSLLPLLSTRRCECVDASLNRRNLALEVQARPFSRFTCGVRRAKLR